jgi:hypothetical protein
MYLFLLYFDSVNPAAENTEWTFTVFGLLAATRNPVAHCIQLHATQRLGFKRKP